MKLIQKVIGGDNLSRKIAFTGIFAGISVVLLYLGALTPTGKISLYFLSSLPVTFTIMQWGAGAGVTLFIAVSMISGILTGNIYGVVPFVFFFGHYPIFKFLIEKKRKAVVEVILKLVVFNCSMLLWYLLFRGIFLENLPVQLTGGMLPAALYAGLQLVFIIYDYVLSRLIFYFEDKLDVIKRG